jgi:hypothetical protein
VPPAAPPTDGPGSDGAEAEGSLPSIQGNKRQLRDVTEDAHRALLARSDSPTLFQRGGVLTRLRLREEDDAPLLEPLTDSALRGVLARVANWTKVRDTRGGEVVEDDAPPLEAVKDLATLPGWDGIPYLRAVIETPVFSASGELLLAPGYHATAGLWHHPAPGLVIPEVPAAPTAEQIARARDLLLVELFGDFPFKDEASRAHAVAATILPFVRTMIAGPTPMHLLDAPTEGTGKTLLASVIAIVGTGRDVDAMAEASNDEEWRKRITATLAEGPTFVLLDNLSRVLDCPALASVLTVRSWKDRLLGVSKTVRLPVTCVWLASGNNTRLSRELIRRTLWCRLDAQHDAPWERTGFRHPRLIAWAKANRGLLVGAALTLVQAWIAAGRPPGGQTLGMFEDWVDVIGGILELAGIPGLLANARDFRAQRADTVSEWRAFVTSWWDRHNEALVGVEELYTLVTTEKLLDSVLGDKGERSQRIRLGRALGKAADRVYGEYRMERGADDHKGRQQFRLKHAPAPPQASDMQQWET